MSSSRPAEYEGLLVFSGSQDERDIKDLEESDDSFIGSTDVGLSSKNDTAKEQRARLLVVAFPTVLLILFLSFYGTMRPESSPKDSSFEVNDPQVFIDHLDSHSGIQGSTTSNQEPAEKTTIGAMEDLSRINLLRLDVATLSFRMMEEDSEEAARLSDTVDIGPFCDLIEGALDLYGVQGVFLELFRSEKLVDALNTKAEELSLQATAELKHGKGHQPHIVVEREPHNRGGPKLCTGCPWWLWHFLGAITADKLIRDGSLKLRENDNERLGSAEDFMKELHRMQRLDDADISLFHVTHGFVWHYLATEMPYLDSYPLELAESFCGELLILPRGKEYNRFVDDDLSMECRHSFGHGVYYVLATRERLGFNATPSVRQQFRYESGYKLGDSFVCDAFRICNGAPNDLALFDCKEGLTHSYRIIGSNEPGAEQAILAKEASCGITPAFAGATDTLLGSEYTKDATPTVHPTVSAGGSTSSSVDSVESVDDTSSSSLETLSGIDQLRLEVAALSFRMMDEDTDEAARMSETMDIGPFCDLIEGALDLYGVQGVFLELFRSEKLVDALNAKAEELSLQATAEIRKAKGYRPNLLVERIPHYRGGPLLCTGSPWWLWHYVGAITADKLIRDGSLKLRENDNERLGSAEDFMKELQRMQRLEDADVFVFHVNHGFVWHYLATEMPYLDAYPLALAESFCGDLLALPRGVEYNKVVDDDLALGCRHSFGHGVYYVMATRERLGFNATPSVRQQFRYESGYKLGDSFFCDAIRICSDAPNDLARKDCSGGVAHSYRIIGPNGAGADQEFADKEASCSMGDKETSGFGAKDLEVGSLDYDAEIDRLRNEVAAASIEIMQNDTQEAARKSHLLDISPLYDIVEEAIDLVGIRGVYIELVDYAKLARALNVKAEELQLEMTTHVVTGKDFPYIAVNHVPNDRDSSFLFCSGCPWWLWHYVGAITAEKLLREGSLRLGQDEENRLNSPVAFMDELHRIQKLENSGNPRMPIHAEHAFIWHYVSTTMPYLDSYPTELAESFCGKLMDERAGDEDPDEECRHGFGHGIFYVMAMREREGFNATPSVLHPFRDVAGYEMGDSYLCDALRMCNGAPHQLAIRNCKYGVIHSHSRLAPGVKGYFDTLIQEQEKTCNAVG